MTSLCDVMQLFSVKFDFLQVPEFYTLHLPLFTQASLKKTLKHAVCESKISFVPQDYESEAVSFSL